jgi:hypothetical protein
MVVGLLPLVGGGGERLTPDVAFSGGGFATEASHSKLSHRRHRTRVMLLLFQQQQQPRVEPASVEAVSWHQPPLLKPPPPPPSLPRARVASCDPPTSSPLYRGSPLGEARRPGQHLGLGFHVVVHAQINRLRITLTGLLSN